MGRPVWATWIANLKGPEGPRGPAGKPRRTGAATVPATAPLRAIMTVDGEEWELDFEIPRGLPGTNAVANDAAFATYIEANDTETWGAMSAKVGPGAVLNPETPMNSAVVEVTETTLGAGVPGLMKLVDARSNISMSRPAWAGAILWRIRDDQPVPAAYDPTKGDEVEQVSSTPETWTPLYLPGLRFWIDPRRAAVADGAAVASLPVRARSAMTLSQADTAKQPTYSTAFGPGGALIFDGVDDFMTSNAFPSFDSRTSEVYAVVRPDAATADGGSHFFYDALGAGGSDFYGPGIGYGANYAYLVNGVTGYTEGTMTPQARVMLRMAKWADGHILLQRLDANGGGTSVLTTPAGFTTRFDQIAISLGARGLGTSGRWKGAVGHVVAVEGFMSTENRARLAAFFAQMNPA